MEIGYTRDTLGIMEIGYTRDTLGMYGDRLHKRYIRDVWR